MRSAYSLYFNGSSYQQTIILAMDIHVNYSYFDTYQLSLLLLFQQNYVEIIIPHLIVIDFDCKSFLLDIWTHAKLI